MPFISSNILALRESAVVSFLLFVIQAPPPESHSQIERLVCMQVYWAWNLHSLPLGTYIKPKANYCFLYQCEKKNKENKQTNKQRKNQNTTTITKRFNRNMRNLLYLKRHIILRSAMGVILCLDFFFFLSQTQLNIFIFSLRHSLHLSVQLKLLCSYHFKPMQYSRRK